MLLAECDLHPNYNTERSFSGQPAFRNPSTQASCECLLNDKNYVLLIELECKLLLKRQLDCPINGRL
jgi:hypothetical protein